MIVKKVPPSSAAIPKTKAANVRDLLNYVAGPDAGVGVEKVEHRGALNLLNVDHDGQVQEMIDLAEMARRSPQPVQHWVFSWREGEQPSPAQADEVVRLFLGEMGLAEHQAVYALHRDTDNSHLHLAVNRVHPATERVATVNNGFDIEVAHRAIARIESAQGWSSEVHALFVERQGVLQRAVARESAARKPSTRARDLEERRGEQSAERLAIERAAPVIRAARSWREVHRALADVGIRFEPKGSGAILWVGEQPVKASVAGRDCSMAALRKRLGEFEPPVTPVVQRPMPPQPLHDGAPAWREYSDARVAHYQRARQLRNELDAGSRQRLDGLRERHAAQRAALFKGSWKGRGELLSATRSVLAARQAREKLDLRDAIKREQGALRKQWGRFPNYDEWLRARSPELEGEWRHRDRRPAVIEGPTFEPPGASDIRDFRAVVEAGRVLYVRADDGRRSSRAAFADRGKRIDIFHGLDRAAVLAALQLSAQKWGSFEVQGNDKFKRLCVELAAEHGFHIANPELQDAIEAARERRRPPVTRGRPAERLVARSARPATPAVPASDPVELYRRHLRLVGQEQPPGNPSRVDAVVGLHMRLTGHERSEIENAIGNGARERRPAEERDWSLYAKRAAGFAWSTPGARELEQLVERRAQLLALEGRAHEVDRSRGSTFGR